MDKQERIKSLIIVGGGTTGWMAAAYLARALEGAVRITVIESDAISRIGVGEATVPSILPELFEFLGLPESEWMPQCRATFKIGIRYVNWAYPPEQSAGNVFYHVFGEAPDIDGIPLTHYWLKMRSSDIQEPMSYCCYPSARLCDNFKSPKFQEGSRAVNYAYHFDAQLVAKLLETLATAHGVERIVDTITNVMLDSSGAVGSLKTAKGADWSADLYVDCSGFQGLLINKALREPFISYSNSLLCDRAVATWVPTEQGSDVLRPFTTATALSAGWVWEIPLYGRVGTGYVYSSAFLCAEKAENEFKKFLGLRANDLPCKHLTMRVGRNRKSWVKNCVSLGLASSFIEPLESTGIYFIYAALHHLVRYFPDRSMNPALQDKFNERVAFMVDDVRDFIVLHYCSTSRDDTAFWRANKTELAIPDSLRNILEIYQAGAPIRIPYSGDSHYNSVFEAGFDRFWTNSNYLAILTGMNCWPDTALPVLAHKKLSLQKAVSIFRSIQQSTAKLLLELPPHYDYISKMYRLNASACVYNDTSYLLPSV